MGLAFRFVPDEQGPLSRLFYGVLAAIILLAGLGGLVLAVVEGPIELIGPLITAVGALAAVLVDRARARKFQAEQTRREKLAPIYEGLISLARRAGDQDNTEFLTKATDRLMLWAPPPVIKAWNRWASHDDTEDEDEPTNLLLWEGVVREMRKDLGHKDDSLDRGDVLRLQVSDIHDAIARSERRQLGSGE